VAEGWWWDEEKVGSDGWQRMGRAMMGKQWHDGIDEWWEGK
jgi:hypothetical protein